VIQPKDRISSTLMKVIWQLLAQSDRPKVSHTDTLTHTLCCSVHFPGEP